MAEGLADYSEPGFVLAVEIAAVGSSNLAQLPPDDRTTVAVVRQVLLAPAVFGDLTGVSMTLLDPQPAAYSVGGRLFVAAAGWLYGEHLAIRVLRSWRMTELAAAQHAAALARVGPLVRRLRNAALVVTGEVARVGEGSIRPPSGPARASAWSQAELGLLRVLKGEVNSKHVSVWFPSRPHASNPNAPRLIQGQVGTYLLSRISIGSAEPEHAVVDALDVWPAGDASRIEKLLADATASAEGVT